MLPDGLRVGVDPAKDCERFNVTECGVAQISPDMLGQDDWAETC